MSSGWFSSTENHLATRGWRINYGRTKKERQNISLVYHTKEWHLQVISLHFLVLLFPFFFRPVYGCAVFSIWNQHCTAAMVYDGEVLPLTKVSRNEMGAYLCIATNGVPPSVSKRIILDVECNYNFIFILCIFLL